MTMDYRGERAAAAQRKQEADRERAETRRLHTHTGWHGFAVVVRPGELHAGIYATTFEAATSVAADMTRRHKGLKMYGVLEVCQPDLYRTVEDPALAHCYPWEAS